MHPMSEAQAVSPQIVSNAPASFPPMTFIDAGRVKIGGGCRLVTSTVPAQFADNGKVRIGGGCRLPNR